MNSVYWPPMILDSGNGQAYNSYAVQFTQRSVDLDKRAQMPRPRHTQEEIEEMRERILSASVDLLREQGFEALSIRGIAERVGVSHMVLYSYFENRKAIIVALSEREQQRMEARHGEILRKAEEGDVREVMREGLGFYARVAQAQPRIYRLLWVQPWALEWMVDPHQRIEANLAYLSRLVQLGIQRGVFVKRDATLAAATVLAMVNAPLMLYHNGRLSDTELCDRMAEETVDAAMGYLTGVWDGPDISLPGDQSLESSCERTAI